MRKERDKKNYTTFKYLFQNSKVVLGTVGDIARLKKGRVATTDKLKFCKDVSYRGREKLI